MRDLMAIPASRELGHDTRRMLSAMTILALRDRLMLFLMAECARKRAVARLRCSEKCIRICVTGGAEFGCRIIRIRHDLGHMRLMALLAVLRTHISGMGFVALRAFGLFAVNAVAGRAIERCMLALIFPQLLYLRLMTGKAGVRQRRREGDRQRCMGVLMARQTSFEIKVRLSLVALIA